MGTLSDENTIMTDLYRFDDFQLLDWLITTNWLPNKVVCYAILTKVVSSTPCHVWSELDHNLSGDMRWWLRLISIQLHVPCDRAHDAISVLDVRNTKVLGKTVYPFVYIELFCLPLSQTDCKIHKTNINITPDVNCLFNYLRSDRQQVIGKRNLIIEYYTAEKLL